MFLVFFLCFSFGECFSVFSIVGEGGFWLFSFYFCCCVLFLVGVSGRREWEMSRVCLGGCWGLFFWFWVFVFFVFWYFLVLNLLCCVFKGVVCFVGFCLCVREGYIGGWCGDSDIVGCWYIFYFFFCFWGICCGFVGVGFVVFVLVCWVIYSYDWS